MNGLFGKVFVAVLLFACILSAQTPGVKVDSTTADAQNYYNNATNQIYVDPETKKVYLGYTWCDMPDWTGFTARINNITDNVITDMPTTAEYGYGLPDIRKSSDGSLLVAASSGAQGWFYWDGWANGVTLFKESGVGTAKYDSLNWFDENPAGGPNTNLTSWLQVDENGVIHWLAYDGWGYIFLYKRSVDNGATFSPAVAIGGSYAGLTSIDINFLGGDYPYGAALASDGKGKVAIVISDQGGDIYLVESFDQGETWSEEATNVTDYGFGLIDGFGSDEVPRPDRFLDAVYDKNGELHIVWEASFFLDDLQAGERHPWAGYGSDAPYLKDSKPVINHWSESTGITTVAESLYPKTDLDGVYRLMSGRSRGCIISSPTMAYDATADVLYVGYTQYGEENGKLVDPENDPYEESVARFLSYGELYLTSSSDHGATWSAPLNLTNTPEFDERNFVLNDQVLDGKLHAFYIGDEQPGYEFYAYLPSMVSGVYYYEIDAAMTGVAEKTAGMADNYVLQPAYPNPFNPTTTIEYDLKKSGRVTLKVFNVMGEDVASLVDGVQSAGVHRVQFDAKDLNSGVYFYQLTAGDYCETRRMVLLK